MEHSLPVTPIGPAKEAWSLVESGIVRYWGNKKEGLAIEIEDDEADDAFSRRCSGLRRHLWKDPSVHKTPSPSTAHWPLTAPPTSCRRNQPLRTSAC